MKVSLDINRQQTASVDSLLGLLLSIATLALAGLANGKDWFRVDQATRSPNFGVWSVCYNRDWAHCYDPMMGNQFDYDPAVVATRVFIGLAVVLALLLVILASASVCGSSRVDNYNPFVFPFLAILVFVCLLLGNSIWEGAVRLRVRRTLTPYGMPPYDTQFGFAGGCAWAAFVLAFVNILVYSAYFVLHRSSKQHSDHHDDDGGFDTGGHDDQYLPDA